MKKLFIAALLLVFAGMSTGTAAAKVEIKLGHVGPPVEDKTEIACQVFKKYVEEQSKGEIEVKTFPGSQLGGERELLEGVQMGTIEMVIVTTGPMPSACPEVQVLDTPYLFPDSATAFRLLDGEPGRHLADIFLKKTGVRLLEYGDNGYRHLTNKTRPIHTPADLKGLKIRTMENSAHMALMRSMGAIPTPLPFAEVYTALSQGVVDGQENPIGLIETMKFYEVQKYLTLDGHLYSPFPLFINDGFFKKLSPEQQKIITDGARLWRDEHRNYFAKQEERGLQTIKNAGVEVTAITPEQFEAFKTATLPVAQAIEKEVGKELMDMFRPAAK